MQAAVMRNVLAQSLPQAQTPADARVRARTQIYRSTNTETKMHTCANAGAQQHHSAILLKVAYN